MTRDARIDALPGELVKAPPKSTEALYALIFAACILLALFLLTA